MRRPSWSRPPSICRGARSEITSSPGCSWLRRRRWAPLAAVVAGYACLLWIFVQMVVIPFSALQALYFGIGCLEIGLVLLALGVWPSRAG